MYAVSGVSGHVGKAVAEALLSKGKKVRVIVRDAAKASAFTSRGAEVAVAQLDDAPSLARALAGTEGAFLLLPPAVAEKDMLGRNQRFLDAWVKAIPQSGAGHVVLLSSVGAQQAEGNGPIKTTHFAENVLRKLEGTRASFVRAAYFMENLLNYLQPMRTQGVLPVFGGGEGYPFPMVATRDIGETAAQALLSPPSATQVIELTGPREYSYNDAAQAFSKALGREVKTHVLPMEALTPALTQQGFSPEMALQYREMTEGFAKGLTFEHGLSNAKRGTTTLDQIAQAAG